MHAPWRGGREPRRAEEQPESTESRAESSRVESRQHPRMRSRDDKSVCSLLARSLGKLTRASENAGESRTPAQDVPTLRHSLARRSGHSPCWPASWPRGRRGEFARLPSRGKQRNSKAGIIRTRISRICRNRSRGRGTPPRFSIFSGRSATEPLSPLSAVKGQRG